MKNGDIIVIDSVKELWDDKQQAVVGRVITDKAGNETKIKKGKGGKLEDRWEWLDANPGKAIKLTVAEFKGYPYVADFEVVEDVFVAQAAEKVQAQVKTDRNDSIESQVGQKGGIEILKVLIEQALLTDGEVKECKKYAMKAIEWGSSRLYSVKQILEKIEEAKGETHKDNTETTDRQPGKERTPGQDSGDALEVLPEKMTAGELFSWIISKDKTITTPRVWLEAEYKVSHGEVLTIKKCHELYEQIKKDKGW